MIKELTLVFATLYGTLAVLFGAFGAHALKKVFSEEQLKSFETGVKYQFYHTLVLLVMGFSLPMINTLEIIASVFFIIGIFLFSFSIYGLCISAAKGKKLRFLGPITPLGGLCLVAGWICLLVIALSYGKLV